MFHCPHICTSSLPSQTLYSHSLLLLLPKFSSCIHFFFCLLALSVKFTQGAIPQELRLAAFRLTHITINKLVFESHRRPILPTLDTLPVSHKAFTGHRFCEVVRVHQVGITCLWGDRSIVYRLPEMVGCSVVVAGPGGQSVVPS